MRYIKKPHVVIIDDYFGKNPTDFFQAPLSHGQICAKTFRLFTPHRNITYVSVASSPKLKPSVSKLAAAINYAFELTPDLIVMSMGTTNPLFAEELYTCVQKVHQAGILLVCACSNENLITFPASLPGVIGVRNDRSGILSNGEYCLVDHPCDGVDIISAFPHQLSSNCPHTSVASNSLTTQYIVAKICNIMASMNPPGIDAIRAELKRRSTPKVFGYNYYSNLFSSGMPIDGITIQLQGNFAEALRLSEQLSSLFAKDGYCAGILSLTLFSEIPKLHFCLKEFFPTEYLPLSEKISLLFKMVSIDLLFMLPDFETTADQISADLVISVGCTDHKKAITIPSNYSEQDLYTNYAMIRKILTPEG